MLRESRAWPSLIDAGMDALIDDFYAEIQRHPDAARVITGGQAQITRLMASLRAWLRESLKGRSDVITWRVAGTSACGTPKLA